MTKLLLFICLTAFTVRAQNIKIGDISISDALAKEYFLDCYKRPDTVYCYTERAKNSFKFAIAWYRNPEAPTSVRPVLIPVNSRDTANEPPGVAYTYLLLPREPSAEDFRDWFLRKAELKKR